MPPDPSHLPARDMLCITCMHNICDIGNLALLASRGQKLHQTLVRDFRHISESSSQPVFLCKQRSKATAWLECCIYSLCRSSFACWRPTFARFLCTQPRQGHSKLLRYRQPSLAILIARASYHTRHVDRQRHLPEFNLVPTTDRRGINEE